MAWVVPQPGKAAGATLAFTMTRTFLHTNVYDNIVTVYHNDPPSSEHPPTPQQYDYLSL